jgi:hypothetical protein
VGETSVVKRSVACRMQLRNHTTSPHHSESRILYCVYFVQRLANVIKKISLILVFAYPSHHYSIVLYSKPDKTNVEQMANILQFVVITYLSL